MLRVFGGSGSFVLSGNGIGMELEWRRSDAGVEGKRFTCLSRASWRAGRIWCGFGPRLVRTKTGTSPAHARRIRGWATRSRKSTSANPRAFIPAFMVVAGYMEIGTGLYRDKRLSAEFPRQPVRGRAKTGVSTVSHHLKKLGGLGLVEGARSVLRTPYTTRLGADQADGPRISADG